MEYNDLINDFFLLLDDLEEIKKFKDIKYKLLQNKNLLNDLKKYHLVNTVSNKKKLYKYPDYVIYLKLEMKIRLLIESIKKEFNLNNRKCYYENN